MSECGHHGKGQHKDHEGIKVSGGLGPDGDLPLEAAFGLLQCPYLMTFLQGLNCEWSRDHHSGSQNAGGPIVWRFRCIGPGQQHRQQGQARNEHACYLLLQLLPRQSRRYVRETLLFARPVSRVCR